MLRNIFWKFLKPQENIMQKLLIIGIIWTMFFNFTGCALKKSFGVNAYSENIIAIYFNDKKEEVAFIGEKYHYLFRIDTKKLTEVLRVKELLKIQINNIDFYTQLSDTPSSVKSRIGIKFDKENLSQKQISWITSHGFHELVPKDNSSAKGSYLTVINMKGIRYKFKKKINQKVSKLDQPIPLKVLTFKIDNLAKLEETPLKLYGKQPFQLESNTSILSPLIL